MARGRRGSLGSQAKITCSLGQTFVIAVIKCPGLRKAVPALYVRCMHAVLHCSTAILMAKGVYCILLLACSYHRR